MKKSLLSLVLAMLMLLSVMPFALAAPNERVETITANLYLPGEYNGKLPNVTAYLNNHKNPLEGSGMPTKPLTKNAKLKTDKNGDMYLTLALPNPVFTLQKLGNCKNAQLVSTKKSSEMKYLGSSKDKPQNRISEITVKLNDKSGEYIFENSTVFPTMLSKNIENVPLHLEVEFNKTEKPTQAVTEKAEETKKPQENATEIIEDESTVETQIAVENETAENITDIAEETQITQETTQENEKGENKNIALPITIAVLAVVIVAGAAVFVYKKKKA